MNLSAAAWIAIAAACAAAAALALFAYLLVQVRRLRAGQEVLLGGGKGDLVDFAVSLQGRIDDLHRAVDEIASGLTRVDRRVDGSISNTAIVRYDAYEGAGGQQSATMAFLDAARSGIVVSAIQGRDYARVYVKELDHGRPSVALSPEELEAVERAMAGAGSSLAETEDDRVLGGVVVRRALGRYRLDLDRDRSCARRTARCRCC